jgi:signal transduction histidine kinase
VVQIRIEDDGPGVPVEARDRVFDPFFTTKPGGTGLGLALAHRTVEEHRGRLTLETPVRGSGAAFVIEFPLADGAPT